MEFTRNSSEFETRSAVLTCKYSVIQILKVKKCKLLEVFIIKKRMSPSDELDMHNWLTYFKHVKTQDMELGKC